jgi:hypothetical protein
MTCKFIREIFAVSMVTIKSDYGDVTPKLIVR